MEIVITISGGAELAGAPSRRVISLARQVGFQVEVVEGQDYISQGATVVIAEHVVLPDGIASRLKQGNMITVADLEAVTFRQFWNTTLLHRNDACLEAAFQIIRLMRDNDASFADADPERLLTNDINDMNFSVRVFNVLDREKIKSMYFLSFWTKGDLNDFRNLGDKGIGEIRRKLALLGLKLAGE
ncbi:MAG TPA: DNA-directed RNA polymerase subunit alpha C-terminal domain-containing protein [Candidatus Saccharimonadales bacterium]|nr:DNA-directed RNA polymerase subunit alpha C-terminal domain-containing protein [Candidatus Saccharimonadales bacterium]